MHECRAHCLLVQRIDPHDAAETFVGAPPGMQQQQPATACCPYFPRPPRLHALNPLAPNTHAQATANRSTFRVTRELEKYGAMASAAAGREHVGYVVEATKLEVAAVTELLLDAVINARCVSVGLSRAWISLGCWCACVVGLLLGCAAATLNTHPARPHTTPRPHLPTCAGLPTGR